MACNCGKNATPPAGTSPGPAGTGQTATNPASSAEQGQAAPASRPAQQSFTLQVNGRTQTFGSRLERDAARVRAQRGQRG